MKRRTVIAIALVLLGAGFVIVLFWTRQSSATRQAVVEASQALRTGSSDQAARGAHALQQLGPRAVPILTRQLAQEESFLQGLRKRIAPALPGSWRTRLHSVFPPRDPFMEKLDAVRALAALGSAAASAVPALERALHAPELTISWTAATALGQIGPAGLPPLVRCLQDTNAVLRQTGCYGLGVMGTNAAPAGTNLIVTLGDPDSPVRLAGQDALFRIGEPAMELLARATLVADVNVRTGALQVLHHHAARAEPAIPTLVLACADTNADIRRFAAQALGLIWPYDPLAVNALTRLLDDPEEPVRLEAARTLGQSGPRAEPALARLTAMLREPSPAVRESAARAFLRMGALARPAVPELEKLRADESEAVRTAASNSIVAILASPEPRRTR
jgi:HEAT repeat protein